MAIRQNVAMEVGHLPSVVYGHKSSLWWGGIGLIAIEGTAFGLAIASYFYLRLREATWPPQGWSPPGMLFGTINLALIVLNAWPMRAIEVEGRRLHTGTVRTLLAAWITLSAFILLLRGFEFQSLHVKWDSNAYGSIVWIIFGLHTLHLLSSFAETVVITCYLSLHPLDPKHALDLEINAVYWYFIVVSWAIIYCVVYLGPYYLK
jgi:cytochrome c oxidase subunit III